MRGRNRASSPTLSTVVLTGALALVAVAPVGATWFYSAHSVYQSRAGSVPHPGGATQVLVLPNDAVRPLVCVAYGNSLGKGKGGTVETAVTITTPAGLDIFGLEISPVVREMSLSGKVSNNAYLNCKVAPDMLAGDVVEFDHLFKGAPSIKSRDEELEYVEIAGVVSDAGEPSVWSSPNGFRLPEGNSPRGVVPGKREGWHHAVNAVFQAEEIEQKHPKKAAHTLLVTDELKKPKVCAGYSNMASSRSKGKLITTVTIGRADGTAETVKLTGKVRKNTALSCKTAGALAAGDLVDFSFVFKGMPKLGRYDQTIEFADVTGVVSGAGEPDFRAATPEPPAPLPDPNPPGLDPPSTSAPPTSPGSPTPAPPSGSGGGSGGGSTGSVAISQADERAASKLLKNNTKTQLWRAKSYSPAKWVAVGPKTRAISGNLLDYNTAGIGSTIAAAVANYESKMGSLGTQGGLLSSGEKSMLEWYSGINPSGPTSVRRDGGGNYHGEFYRNGRGAVHHGPLSSLKGALDWLRAQGL